MTTSSDQDLSTTRVARVARVENGWAEVLVDGEVSRVDVADGIELVAGDEVVLSDGVAVERSARRTEIRRAAASGRSVPQVLAANVDVVLVAVTAVPAPRLGMVERMVALAWDSGATPVVVVTKCDLTPDVADVLEQVAAAAVGVDVLATSAVTGEGVDAVRALDRDGTVLCVLGRSGAGKSTLSNLLLGEDRMVTGEVRRDGKGRHTTTTRELVVLPGGGLLIDTPGLRGVGLWLDGDGLAHAFPDIEDLAERCGFRDCRHDTEPGCAVLAAVASGEVDRRRVESWHKLAREAEWIASRSDARLRAERSRQWRQISRANRAGGRVRP